jgi:hypothetical protein
VVAISGLSIVYEREGKRLMRVDEAILRREETDIENLLF